MTAANTRAGGKSFTGCDPMVPISGPNTAPNTKSIPNVGNYYCCGGNELTVCSIRTSTLDAGGFTGAASGRHSAKLDPMQGSGKCFIQGSPATRLGDMSMTNDNNASSTQITPSQTKYFINA